MRFNSGKRKISCFRALAGLHSIELEQSRSGQFFDERREEKDPRLGIGEFEGQGDKPGEDLKAGISLVIWIWGMPESTGMGRVERVWIVSGIASIDMIVSTNGTCASYHGTSEP